MPLGMTAMKRVYINGPPTAHGRSATEIRRESPATASLWERAIGRLEGEPLYHASFDAAEYRKLLEEVGFAVVATIAEDQACGGRTV